MPSLRDASCLAITALLVVGCSSSTGLASPSAERPSATATFAAGSSSPSSPAPSFPVPASIASATPQPTVGESGWSGPHLIRSGECFDLTATIDGASRYHVALVCDGGIRYLTSTDRVTWAETSFVPAIDRLESGPQLAVDGDTIYLAFTRLAPEDGGCGDDGLRDVGVYIRSRHLPDGAWSEAVRVGTEGDHVQAFRATGGVLHLTVTAADGASVFYESNAGPTLTRIALPNASETSLRVGDDGRARIAYTTGHAIRFGLISGGALSAKTIAETDQTFLRGPSLVLGPGDHGYLLWTQYADSGGGCAEVGPGPLDGTYFGSDASGAWVSRRISLATDATSLTLDPSTGQLHAIIKDGALRYFTTDGAAPWLAAEIPDSSRLTSPVIRLDPSTGRIVVFAVDWGASVEILTNP